LNTLKLRLALATAATALLAVPVALADADFTDPSGDAGTAPDVTDVSVFNDSGNRVIFGAKIAGGKAMAADGEIVFVVDSDKNAETGRNGWDYLVVLTGAKQWNLLSWNGTEWAEATANTVKAYFYDDVVLLALDRSELGNTAAFDFFVESNQYAGEQVLATDTAPDGDGVWSYATVRKTLGLAASPVVAVTKGGARQGKAFVAGYAFARTDSPEPAAGAKTTCAATVAGKRIAARVGNAAQAAACTVTLPKASKGKLLKLTLKTTYAGKVVTKSYSTKVKA
jgi:hypothetical protein